MKSIKKLTPIKILYVSFIIFFITVFAVQTFMYSYGEDKRIINSDGLGYYSYLHSIFFDKDLDFKNQYLDMYGNLNLWIISKTKTGLHGNVYAIGTPILWIPLFLTAHILTLIFNQIGFNIIADGYSALYQYFIVMGSLLYGFIGFYIIYKWCCKYFNEWISLTSVLLMWWGGSLLQYSFFQPGESHILSVMTTAFFYFYYINISEKITLKNYIILGFLGGLMSLVRWQNATHSIILFYPIIKEIIYNKKIKLQTIISNLKGIIIYSVIWIIILSPQMYVWKILYGSYFTIPQSSSMGHNYFADLIKPNIISVLFSTRHGMITWTPIVLFAVLGFYYFIKKYPALGITLCISFFIQLYANAANVDWWCGDSFGIRRMINTVPLLTVSLGFFIQKISGYGKKAIYGLLAAGIAIILWNAVFVIQYKLQWVPNHDYLTFNQLVTSKFIFPFKVLNKIF